MPTYKVISQVKHDGQIYAPDSTIELEAEAATELLSFGVIQDPTADDAEAQPAPAAPPVNNEGDEELERGKVDEQLADNVNQDLADNQQLAATPGTPVVNNSTKSGIAAKIKSAVSGQPAPAAPPAPANTPSAEEIAKDPQLQ